MKARFCSRSRCSVTSRNVPVWKRGSPSSSLVNRTTPEYQRYSPSSAQRKSSSMTPSCWSVANEASTAARSSGWTAANASEPSRRDSSSRETPVMAAIEGLM